MAGFDLLKYSAMFEEPGMMSAVSAWVGHIPFAKALVQMMRPGALVELGTHMGDSYLAFCQTVRGLGLGTRCYAVDTWEGDPHAGRYGGEVLEGLRRAHDPQYGAFSTLMRMDFDAAVGRFADGSVDLLHIDGLHTYEAVRHDWETWRPKVSEAGVVLFHDTAVRREDFGVWRLWTELAGEYPSFEFGHGYGLGVLAVGRNLSREVREFMEYARARPGDVRGLFAGLGGRLEARQQVFQMMRPLHQWRVAAAQWRERAGVKMEGPPVDLTRGMADPVGYTWAAVREGMGAVERERR